MYYIIATIFIICCIGFGYRTLAPYNQIVDQEEDEHTTESI